MGIKYENLLSPLMIRLSTIISFQFQFIHEQINKINHVNVVATVSAGG